VNQPRVPSGNPNGGQWTSRSPSSSRGDYHALTGGSNSTEVKFKGSAGKQKQARAKQAELSVVRGRKLLKDLGMDVDDVRVIVTDDLGSGLSGDFYAPDIIGVHEQSWLGGKSRIMLNVGTRYFDRVFENQKELHASGLHSTGHKDHAIIHEMGHELHNQLEQQKFTGVWHKRSAGTWNQAGSRQAPNDYERANQLAAESKKVARTVSRYAAQNPHEFVAEVFTAGVLKKTKFSDEVQVLYDELNGPHPDKVFGG